jgi:rhodanese-related sulfurtransferase
MGVRRFLLVDGAGTLLWAIVYCGAGYLLGKQLDVLFHAGARLGGWFVLAVGLALALYLGTKLYARRKLLRELAIARIAPRELKDLLDAGVPVLIADIRHPSELTLGMLPGALPLERLDGAPRDRDVVLYCSCPNEVASAREALRLKGLGFTRVRPLEGGFEAWVQLGFPVTVAAAVTVP